MSRNINKQSGRSNFPMEESSGDAISYLVRDDDDDDDRLALLPDESSLQVRPTTVVASSGHMTETTVPNFLLKLWRLVEDNNYDFCISWDESGLSFHVKEPYIFSKDVLPLFFKHSNLNSFIRQLNMYGFRKVTNLEQGALKHQSNDLDSLEFHHQYFVRGHPELLQYIRRKTSSKTATGELVSVHSDAGGIRRLNQALEEIRQLREKQLNMDAKLNLVKRENESLWRETAQMRQLHMKQQQVVNRLIQFLLTVAQPASEGRLGKRGLLAIGSGILNQQADRGSNQAPRRKRAVSGDAAEMMESLEQELKKRPRPIRPRPVQPDPTPSSSNSSNAADAGPMIADVTEELEPEVDVSPLNTVETDNIPAIVYARPSANMQTNVSAAGAVNQGPQPATFELNEPDPLASLVSAVPSSRVTQQQPTAIDRQQAVAQPWAASGLTAAPFHASGRPTQLSYNDPALLSPPGKLLENETDEWSRPGGEFSQYLNYVQSDLDSLKDFLSSEGLELDSNSLNDLFVPESETSGASAPILPTAQEGGIVGNELQLYKAPELLVDFSSGPTGAGVSGSATPSALAFLESEPVPLSGGLGANESNKSPIFASPATQQQPSIFDQLDYDFLNADPVTSSSSQGALTTPIISPSLDQIYPTLQQRRTGEASIAAVQSGAEPPLQDQTAQGGNGVRADMGELLPPKFSKSKVGKRR